MSKLFKPKKRPEAESAEVVDPFAAERAEEKRRSDKLIESERALNRAASARDILDSGEGFGVATRDGLTQRRKRRAGAAGAALGVGGNTPVTPGGAAAPSSGGGRVVVTSYYAGGVAR